MRTTLRPNGVRPVVGLLLLAGVLYLAGRISGAGWVIVMMCGVVGLAVIGTVWPVLHALRVRAELTSAPRDGTVGVPAPFTVQAGPARMGARLRLSVAGGVSDDVGLTGAGSITGSPLVMPGRRGVVTTATISVDVDGPLGLSRWTRRFDVHLPVVLEVGPAVPRTAPRRLLLHPDRVGQPARDAGVPRGHESTRGVREYGSGDPIRLVHWPATARWARPMVREMEGEAARRLHLVVDLRGDAGAVERAASDAAGLANAALSDDLEVILHTAEAGGPSSGRVRSAREVGRRLARAVTNAAPRAPGGADAVWIRAGGRDGPPGPLQPRSSARETMLARLARINARQPAEGDWRVRVATLVAVMTAALAVFAQSVGGPGFRLLVLGGIPAGLSFSWWSRHRPGYVTKLALAVGAVLGFLWFLKTLAGITGGTVADAQTPLAELVLLVQVLQTFDATAGRDLRFSVLISLVVMAAAGLLSISLSLLPYLVVWAVAGVAVLVLSQRSALAALPALAPPGRTTTDTLEHHQSVGAALVGRVVVAVGAVLFVGLGVFAVAPAAGTARALTFPAALDHLVPVAADGGLENPTLGTADPAGRFAAEARAGRPVTSGRLPFGYFGFSTVLDLAARGRPDDTLVMRVRASHEAMWFGQAFDVWDGRRWSISNQRSIRLGGTEPIVVPPPFEQAGAVNRGPAFIQTYYVLQPGANIVFGADPPTQVYLAAGHLDELTDGTLRTSVELGPGTIYTVVSRPPLVTTSDLRRTGTGDAGTPELILRRYAGPTPVTPRVRALAASVTASAPTTYDKVLALEAWIGAHTRYSLRPPPLPAGADAVDRFLFVDRKGFCEQIATSLVVMLRSLGIPSRLAVGYAGGTRDPLTGVFDVRASDAHSWAEVWFPGIGWQPFDPTASVPLAGDAGLGASSGLLAFLSGHLPSIPLPVGVGAGSLLGLGLAGAATRRFVRARRRRDALDAARPVPSWAASCQQRLESVVGPLARRRDQGETVQEYVAAVTGTVADADALRTVADLIDRSAFSGVELSSDEQAWVDEVLDGIAHDGVLLGSMTNAPPRPPSGDAG